MSDFEARLKQLVNEDVDARLGPERPAPPMRPPADRPVSERTRTKWLPPLLAAACIAVVAVGALAAPQLLSDDRNPADPIGPTPTVRPTVTTPSPTVTALGARVGLPDGWRVGRTLATYVPGVRAVCLQPASRPLVSDPGRCPVLFYAGSPTSGLLGSTGPDFALSGSIGCTANRSSLGDSGDRRIGNRDADWRVDRCEQPSGPPRLDETYAVVTDPGYALYTQSGDAAVRRAITVIAQRTQLPSQDAPLRLTDVGILRQVQIAGDVVRIRLDRTVPSPSGDRNGNPRTYAYTVPLTVWRKYRADGPLTVGSSIQLSTDGNAVTLVRPLS